MQGLGQEKLSIEDGMEAIINEMNSLEIMNN